MNCLYMFYQSKFLGKLLVAICAFVVLQIIVYSLIVLIQTTCSSKSGFTNITLEWTQL